MLYSIYLENTNNMTPIDCLRCKHHDYDGWVTEDDCIEFEICLKNHELYPHECTDYSE